MFDVCIIGAGVVGGAIAREFSKYNVKVCILEKENDVAMGTSKANSGIVHAGFDAKENTLKAKLNVLGSKMMESLTKELGVSYLKNGALVIGFNEEDENTINQLYQRGIINGVENLSVISGDKAREIDNVSKNVTCALYAKDSAIVCPYDLTLALIGNAMDNGAELLTNFKVESINEENGNYEITSNTGLKVNCKCVINAAGLFADEVAKMVGDNSIKITPRRGEYMLLDKSVKLVNSTIFKTPSKMGKGILVTPTTHGNILVGPTSEDVMSKTNLETTKQGLDILLQKAPESVEDIPFNKVITSFTGLRAVSDGGDFIIRGFKKGFINVAGIESPGLTASPAISLEVLEIYKSQGFTLEKNPNFNPYRESYYAFKNASLKEKNEIIKKDSRYGKIICRCETVSEGEIVNAILKNPQPSDVDGIKRRTRSQTGRCQGGFCTPYLIKLLAKHKNMEVEKVTKKGGNSFIVFNKLKEENYD